MDGTAVKAWGGSIASFEDFYGNEFPLVFRAALLLAGDRAVAEDATQEAFKRAYVRWGRLNRTDWAGGWVMTTALNICRRSLRKGRPGPPMPGFHESHEGDSAGRVDLVRGLQALPPRQRQAVILYYLGDLHVAAVAELMNVNEGTVKAHLAQAREALRRSLGGER